MKKLTALFATDFSPNAKDALKASKPLRDCCEADIHLEHIIRSFWKDWASSGRHQKECMQRLASWQSEILEEDDDKKLHVEQGNVAETILKTANDINADVIMLGAKKEANGRSRYKMGVAPEAVVRSATRPVMILKDDIAVSKILCAIDGSETSGKTLEWALKMARGLPCKLTIISVLPKIDFNPMGMSKEEIEQNEQEFKEKQIAKIEEFLSSFDFKDVDVDKQYPWGTPSNVVLDMAEDHNYDLITIGATGQSKLKNILIGSTAEKVLRYTPCSLFVVR